MAQADVSSCQASEETEQLRKLNRLESVLAVTLPFKQKDVSPDLFDLAINQTQKGWAWFVRSRELDIERGTELGTLGYLPWETRQQVLKVIIDGQFYGESQAPRTLCYDLTASSTDVFNLDSYYVELVKLRLRYPSQGISDLRLSSVTLSFEYDSLFLSNTIFKFQCRTVLDKFLAQLSDLHQTKLRSIIISIWVPCGCGSRRLRQDWEDGWKTSCFQMPASLRQVSFELRCSRPRNHALSCANRRFPRRYSEFKVVANLVEVLSKRIVRSAPEAVMEMHEDAKAWLRPEELELFDAALNDIER